MAAASATRSGRGPVPAARAASKAPGARARPETQSSHNFYGPRPGRFGESGSSPIAPERRRDMSEARNKGGESGRLLSQLDAALRTVHRRDQSGSGRGGHGQIEAELAKHLRDPLSVGMLGAQAGERRARRGGLRRMRGLAPVDEERDDAVAQNRRRTREPPGEEDAVRALPASGTDSAELDAVARGVGHEALE